MTGAVAVEPAEPAPGEPGSSPEPPGQPARGVADRVFKGALAMSLVAMVNIVGQLVVVPVGLSAWGATRWGEWLALSGVVTFLALTDLGMQSHVVNRMNAHHARGEHDQVLAALHSAVRVQAPLAILIWTVGAAVLALLPLERWLGITTATHLETWCTVLLLGAELLIGVPMGAVRGVYRATGELAWAAVLTAVRRVMELGLPIVLMLCGAGFSTVALGRVTWVVLFDLFLLRDLHRGRPWFRMWPLGGDVREGLRMLPASGLFLIAGLADYLSSQGNVMVLQSALGGIAVAQFATHRTVVNMGRLLAQQFSAATWPEMTSLDALGESARLVRTHRTLTKLTAFLVGAVLLGFLPLSRYVYAAWTRRALSLEPVTLGLLTAQTIVWSVWGTGSTVLLATNRQGRLVIILALNGLLVLGLSALLVPRLGVEGAAVANLCADLCVASWAVPRAVCQALGDSLAGFWGEVLPALGLSLLVPALLEGLAFWALPQGPLRAIVPSALFGVLAPLLLWRALQPDERAVALRVLDKLRRRLAASRARPA
jgi:O-antigen/teichoic acid export membrane protein